VLRLKGVLIFLVSLFCLVLVSGFVSSADCGGAVQCQCGDNLTSSQTMWYHLPNCPGKGLVIANENVVLDCDGHTIDGDASFDGKDYGIEFNSTNNDTIQNCFIKDFKIGVYINYYQDKHTIIHNKISNNHVGIYNIYSDNNNISFNTISNNMNGTTFYNSKNNFVSFNNISFNDLNAIQFISGSSFNEIYNNTISYNYGGIYSQNSNNTIWNNKFTNIINAYDFSWGDGSSWNISNFGNYWSDFENNPGYPNFYEIPGNSNGRDYWAQGLDTPLMINAMGNKQVDEGSKLSMEITAFYPNFDILTYYTNAAEVLPSSDFILSPGTGVWQFNWTPTYYDQGSYNVTFNVTDGEHWDEQTITITVNNTPATDLYLTADDISFSEEIPKRDQTIYITAVLYNGLEINPEEILVEFYDGPKFSGTFIGADTITTERSDTYFAQTSWTAELGIHNIYVYLNQSNETEDVDYTNNVAFQEITVIVFPDMMVRTQDIGLSNPEPQENEEVNILAMIHNVEDVPTGNFNVLFYLNDQSNVIAERTLSLEEDNTELLVVPWTAVIGNHAIYVKVDYDHQVCEQDEDNNEAFKMLNVTYEIPECNDGTPSGQCAGRPLYCDGGTLVNNCHVCGCSGYQRCLPNGNCGKKVFASRMPDPI